MDSLPKSAASFFAHHVFFYSYILLAPKSLPENGDSP